MVFYHVGQAGLELLTSGLLFGVDHSVKAMCSHGIRAEEEVREPWLGPERLSREPCPPRQTHSPRTISPRGANHLAGHSKVVGCRTPLCPWRGPPRLLGQSFYGVHGVELRPREGIGPAVPGRRLQVWLVRSRSRVLPVELPGSGWRRFPQKLRSSSGKPVRRGKAGGRGGGAGWGQRWLRLLALGSACGRALAQSRLIAAVAPGAAG
ncbi:hypothetical protein AAY473_027780 [Plecturocebus cupreus]